MEVATDQSANSLGGSLLRYPLRSATKAKELKPLNDEPNVTSSTRRVRTTPNVAKSMSELDLSGKEKSVKPPTRLNKPTNSPHAIPTGSLTPISENQRIRLDSQLNNDTPMSDASKSSHRRKFCVLSSASYWLAQIKLSESASNHSVSIGFFRLALESGVEPLHRIREELKSYVLKYNLLAELENTTKDILNSYNIQDIEKLDMLESSFQLPDVPLNSDERTAPSGRNLKLRFSSRNTLVESNNKDAFQKRAPTDRKKAPTMRNPENDILMNGCVGSSALETSQRPKKLQMSKTKSNSKCPVKNFSSDEVDDSPNEKPKLDKENMVAENMDIHSPK